MQDVLDISLLLLRLKEQGVRSKFYKCLDQQFGSSLFKRMQYFFDKMQHRIEDASETILVQHASAAA